MVNPSRNVARAACLFLGRPAVGEAGSKSCQRPIRGSAVRCAARLTQAGVRPGNRVDRCVSPSAVRVVSHLARPAVLPVPVTLSTPFHIDELGLPLNYSRSRLLLSPAQVPRESIIADEMPWSAPRETSQREPRRQFTSEKK